MPELQHRHTASAGGGGGLGLGLDACCGGMSICCGGPCGGDSDDEGGMDGEDMEEGEDYNCLGGGILNACLPEVSSLLVLARMLEATSRGVRRRALAFRRRIASAHTRCRA